MKKTILSLLLCLSMALGIGLTATGPAKASIIYVGGTQTATSTTPINLLLDGSNRLQIQVSSGSYVVKVGIITLGTLAYQASGIYNNAGTSYKNVNVPLGHDAPLNISLPFSLGSINVGSYPYMDNIPFGTSIGSNYTALAPVTVPVFNTTAQIGGFAGNVTSKPSGGSTSVLGTYGAFTTWGYAGFQFQDTDGIHYGWVHAIADYNTSNYTITDVKIDGYAYNTAPGQSILAGQTMPLPASALLLGSR